MKDVVPPQSLREVGWYVGAYDRVALVLQGGGALGAYQVGVYEALEEVGCRPNWLSGVSIGGVNAAIIAGNPPGQRMDRLKEFWELVSARKVWLFTPEGDIFRSMRNSTSALLTMSLGQPGFFRPWPVWPWFQPSGATAATSYYDTTPLRETLERLIDFGRINSGEVRLSVGAVNIRSGNFIYFDNAKDYIGVEHIMASGALPPALPPVKIAGEYYWDGGVVSNTPLQYLLELEESLSTLVFQVDLFSARGILPRDIQDVMERSKDIMYSSRTRANTDNFKKINKLNRQLVCAIKRIPESDRTEEEKSYLASREKISPVNIVHLIYQQKNYEGHAKDYEFSRTSMLEHWQAGYDDTCRTLKHPEWFTIPNEEIGLVVHDLHRDDDK